jgi:glyoxylase-like metal-dependent hydrolase (beta-lactamase superfamily II)
MSSWIVQLVEVGRARHPGAWVGPEDVTPAWMWSPINVLLLRGRSTIMIDAGTGILAPWWPHEGFEDDVVGALARHGLETDQIEIVVVTHLDYDHIGGLVSGSWPEGMELAFPNAIVAMPVEATSWARSTNPEEPLNAGTHIVRFLESESRLVEVSDGEEVVPGVRLRAAPGHRPGHSLVEVTTRDSRLIHGADVLHHVLHAEHPEWDGMADADRELGLATRRRVLAELADERAPCIFSHLAGPRPLTVIRKDAAFRFVAS